MITLRQLRYLSALARLRHFGRAADACSVTQPALSMQIRELEQELGLTLIERGRNEVGLTPDGEEVVRRAEAILADVRELADYAHGRRGGLSGTLRLGIIPSIAPYLLPDVLPALEQRFPGLDLELRETQTAALLDELARGDLDAVILALPLMRPGIEAMPVFEDEFLLAVPREEEAQWRAGDMRARLAERRLLLLEEGHCLRDQALQFCRLTSEETRRTLGATSLATIMQMVAAGYGITLLPRLCTGVEVRDDKVALVPFPAPAPSRTVGLAWRRASARKPAFQALGGAIAQIKARQSA